MVDMVGATSIMMRNGGSFESFELGWERMEDGEDWGWLLGKLWFQSLRSFQVEVRKALSLKLENL
jgi:hypothetical protein